MTGDWWIDCPTFTVRAPVTISGNVVFEGDVNVTSETGHLTIDNAGDPAYGFLRDGLLRKDGQASVTFQETMIYASKTSRVEMQGGGSGSLTWVAPDEDGHPFDDLALWSDSTVTSAPHLWEGQAALQMEGVFFVPIVTAEYAGQGSQQQVSAQFIADRLVARGQGQLVVQPVVGRSVEFDRLPRSMLIR